MIDARAGLCRACGRQLRIRWRSLHSLLLWCAACQHYASGAGDAIVALGHAGEE